MSIRKLGIGGSAIVLWVAVMGALALPALAAAPEEPATREAKSITGTSALLRGELNPRATGVDIESEEYEFAYAPAPSGCAEGLVAPVPPAKALGDPQEPVSVPVKGLEANREYNFCVVALHEGEAAYGQQKTFKTASAAAPKVDSESTSAVTSTAAKLEAQVNPDGQATSYSFEYSTKGKTGAGETLEAPITTVAGKDTLPALYEDQVASVPTGALLAGTTYYYRVVASNATLPASDGAVQSFTTSPLPHGVKVEAITATTATFKGELTPLNEAVGTKYDFAYNVGSSCSGGPTTPEGEEPAGKGTGTALLVEPVTGLQPNVEYTVCLVANNGFGSETSAPVHFPTPASAPTVENPHESGVTPTEATLEATVNPNNEKTTGCEFQYGKTTSYGTVQPCTPASLEGYGAQGVSLPLNALEPGTTYHFLVVAKNAAGTGEITGEFTTPALEAPVIESESTPIVTPHEAQLETAVNPKYQKATCNFEYGSTEPLLKSGVTTVPCPAELGSGGGGVGASTVLSGLTAKTTYYYRVSATNATGETQGTEVEPIKTFETLTLKAPAIESEGASSITQTTATLEAQINPEYQKTTYTFEYAPKEESVLLEGHGTKVTGGELPAGSILAGFGEHSAKAEAKGLEPNTLYYYRVVASNPTGSAPQTPAVATFTTSSVPLATTTPASAITTTAATIAGTVTPDGRPTTYYFQYGGTTNYGQQTLALPAGEGTGATPETAALEGLQPGVIYHYRIVATNTSKEGATQTADGEDETFTATPTAPAPPPVVAPATVVEGPPAPAGPVLSAPATPAFVPYQSIAELNAQEAREDKKLPNPTTTKTLTNAEKLKKALQACHKKRGGKRASCEKQAHRKYPATNKQRKG